ncbi:hypothetical protein [Moorena sp. SIO4G3]|uniref:hypothetical protein n=1 Tax=Moorena sp. SIO4G3 TaxID=2607821 RepID=UPI00142BB601|nr:hypothetical protein [Moorena sp. SIO4G3]NEO80343.1 hypothetical protein [Moorena sp. SIO4G3]
MGRWGDGEMGTGILVELASWWNWHLASFNIFSGGEDGHWHLGGTGILVELASWWNWHLASVNIFSGGEDAHSTGAISHEIQRDPPKSPLTRGTLRFISVAHKCNNCYIASSGKQDFLPLASCLLPLPCSLFPAPCSLLPTPYSL